MYGYNKILFADFYSICVADHEKIKVDEIF